MLTLGAGRARGVLEGMELLVRRPGMEVDRYPYLLSVEVAAVEEHRCTAVFARFMEPTDLPTQGWAASTR